MSKPRKFTADDVFIEGLLLHASTGGYMNMSNAIEASEARGQREMVRSESLPTQLMHGLTETMLEAMGIQLGEPFADDSIFRPATLPEGWKKVPTDHPMWSSVLDTRGRLRLRVFYKAAFYDRQAQVIAENRFSVRTGACFRTQQPGYDRSNDPHEYGDAPGDDDCVVLDFGADDGVPVEMFRAKVRNRPTKPRACDEKTPEQETAWQAYWAAENKAQKAARAWLNEHYPRWEDPSAYWDAE